MSWILNIDTAVATASIALAKGGETVTLRSNPDQRDHAAWLHVAIDALLKEQQLSPADLTAVAVSAGPGSYTGLRVGMATAKGLCFALQKPLITINTLRQMAAAAAPGAAGALLCPMIDARRMEVFTAVFNTSLEEVLPTTNMILEAGHFDRWLDSGPVQFFGNGSAKFKTLVDHSNALFLEVESNAAHLAPLSFAAFQQGQFADLAYAEPFYAKDFYSLVK